jgi:7,8-dihydroneopterin aldolase/epimerase/oxygenase
MDTIFIQGLRVEAMIGAHNWEQRVTRTLRLDIELACDAAQAAREDRLADALNYKTVSDRVRAICGQTRHRLIETLAEELAATLMREFGVAWLKVVVHKPGAVAGAQSVGVAIERGRR